MTAMRRRALGLLTVALVVWGCAPILRPTDTVTVKRRDVTQAYGRMMAIYQRVRELEAAACARGEITPAQCAQIAKQDAEMRGVKREVEAQILTPGYEFNWALVLTTLDHIGMLLDTLP